MSTVLPTSVSIFIPHASLYLFLQKLVTLDCTFHYSKQHGYAGSFSFRFLLLHYIDTSFRYSLSLFLPPGGREGRRVY